MNKLTKKELGELVRKARAHGYFQDQATGRLWTKCPICGDEVECQDFAYGEYRPSARTSRRTTVQMLDAGMTDHLTNYCSECPECYALRGGHEAGCKRG